MMKYHISEGTSPTNLRSFGQASGDWARTNLCKLGPKQTIS